MADGFNYTPQMVGGGDGLGMGGGLIGGVVLGALLGNRGGLFGGGSNGDGGCVGPAAFAAGLAGVSNNIQESLVLNKLGSIEAAIPFTALETQLAIMNSQNAIQSVAVTNATAQALANSATLQAINADGDRTRSLITLSEIATLNRELGVAQTALMEERFARRSRESEINITNTNTNTNAQAQAQFQAQRQEVALANLAATVAAIAGDVNIVRQGQSTVNFGTMTGSGTQAANATQVRS